MARPEPMRKARREGLLALEGDVGALEDQFLKKSIQLVVDGTDHNKLRVEQIPGIIESYAAQGAKEVTAHDLYI